MTVSSRSEKLHSRRCHHPRIAACLDASPSTSMLTSRQYHHTKRHCTRLQTLSHGRSSGHRAVWDLAATAASTDPSSCLAQDAGGSTGTSPGTASITNAAAATTTTTTTTTNLCKARLRPLRRRHSQARVRVHVPVWLRRQAFQQHGGVEEAHGEDAPALP